MDVRLLIHFSNLFTLQDSMKNYRCGSLDQGGTRGLSGICRQFPTQFTFYFLIFSAHDIWSYFHIPLPREREKKCRDYICSWLDRAGVPQYTGTCMGDRIRSEMENGAGLILPMGRFLREIIPLSILMNKIQMVCRFLEIICSQNMISALNIFDVLFVTNLP